MSGGEPRAATPLAVKLAARIARDGPIGIARLHAGVPAGSRAWLLPTPAGHRQQRRFHYRAGDQPGVRGDHRAVVRRRLAADGVAAGAATRRAWPRTRHADARRAARGAARAGVSRRVARGAHREQRNARADPARNPEGRGRCRSAGAAASQPARVRSSSSPTSSSIRSLSRNGSSTAAPGTHATSTSMHQGRCASPTAWRTPR